MASLAILASLVPRPSEPIVSLAPLLSLDPQVPMALIFQHLVATGNHHSGNKHKIVTGRRFCFYLGQKAYSPLFTNGFPMVPWPSNPPGSVGPEPSTFGSGANTH